MALAISSSVVPVAVLDQVPDLSERLRDTDDATKRTLCDAYDPRVGHDTANDRLSISATPRSSLC